MSRYTPDQWIASVAEPDMAMEYMGSSPVHGMVFVQDGVEVLREVLADRDRLQAELQECKAELARVRRNHLRRMRDLIEVTLLVMPFTRDPHWWRHRERLLNKIRAALAQPQDGEFRFAIAQLQNKGVNQCQ